MQDRQQREQGKSQPALMVAWLNKTAVSQPEKKVTREFFKNILPHLNIV
jgi:hypothetical protein